MKKSVFWVFVLLFAISFAIAADDNVSGDNSSEEGEWGDVNTNVSDDGETDDDAAADSEDDSSSNDRVSTPVPGDEALELTSEKEYTINYYWAIGIAIFGILLAVLFIYLFFKNPKNRWRKKVVHGTIAPSGKNSKIVKR